MINNIELLVAINYLLRPVLFLHFSTQDGTQPQKYALSWEVKTRCVGLNPPTLLSWFSSQSRNLNSMASLKVWKSLQAPMSFNCCSLQKDESERLCGWYPLQTRGSVQVVFSLPFQRLRWGLPIIGNRVGYWICTMRKCQLNLPLIWLKTADCKELY